MKTILILITILFSLNTFALSIAPGTSEFRTITMMTTIGMGDFEGVPQYFQVHIHQSGFSGIDLQSMRIRAPFIVDFGNGFLDYELVTNYVDVCGSYIIEARSIQHEITIPEASESLVIFQDNSARICRDLRPIYEVEVQNVNFEGLTGLLQGYSIDR